MPKTLDITTIRKVANLIAGNYRTSFKGVGVEFSDLREYTLGDDAHDIDWKTSAKTNELFVKKYAEERELSTLFVVDCGVDMDFGASQKQKNDTLSEILFTLAFSAADNHDAIGAHFFSDTILSSIPPKKGRAILSLLLQRFSEYQNRQGKQISTTTDVIRHLYEQKTKNHLIFILTDRMDLPNASHLKALCHANDLVWFHIFDRFENTLETVGSVKISDGKTGIFLSENNRKKSEYVALRQEKIRNFQKFIRSSGGDYLIFDNQDNVFKKLYQFFKTRQSRR